MNFKLAGLSLENVPSITKWTYEDLEDAPHLHRWRATWCGSRSGIDLCAYPVVKVTTSGAWIAHHAWRSMGQWRDCDIVRWVQNGSGSAWAKPTQEEAIKSLAIRLTRWTTILAKDICRAQNAIDALAKLRPDLLSYSEIAAKNLAQK